VLSTGTGWNHPVRLLAQEVAGQASTPTANRLPDAPAQQQDAQPANPQPETQRERAERELKAEEQQRVLGVMPNFNTSYIRNAAPLSPRQKFELAYYSARDPFQFVAAALDAGISQAENQFPGYGQGIAGYGKRFGAAYADGADGTLWSNAILPILLREDPRYFRRGTGSFSSRLLYCIETTVWTKNDNGSWGPNYANVGGNLVAGGISNLYYPPGDRGVGLVFGRAFTVTAEGSIGAFFDEFWPDINRRFLHNRFVTGAGAQPGGNH
jgi:hypothetical protein